MRSVMRAVGPVCLAIGGGLLGEALATGGARLYLLLIVPVVSGTSLAFVLSVVFLAAGFLLLPFAFVQEPPAEAAATAPAPPGSSASTGEGGSGGLILVGPIPIFFGTWRRNPPISYRWAILVGVVLAIVAVLLLWGLSVL